MIVKAIYKTLRSILFTVTLLVVGLYVVFYVLFSIPAFTNAIKDKAVEELSVFLGGEVRIADFDVYPFNEVKISGLEVYDPLGEKCLEVETVAGGISLWKLIREGRIEMTYGEIIGLDATISQPEKDAPLNIDFLIQAFSSKDDKKKKNPFEMALRNVVLRKSSVSFTRPWMQGQKIGSLDMSDLRVTNLAADIAFPKLGDQGIEVDLRRLSLIIPEILEIETLSLKGEFSKEKIAVTDFVVALPASRIYIPSLSLTTEEGENFKMALEKGNHILEITESYITPSDFAFLYPPLVNFTENLPMELDAAGNLSDVSIERFEIGAPEVLTLSLRGEAEGIDNPPTANVVVKDFKLGVSTNTFQRLETVLNSLPPAAIRAISAVGNLTVEGEFSADLSRKNFGGNLNLLSNVFTVSAEGNVEFQQGNVMKGEGEVTVEDLRLDQLVAGVPVENLNANIVMEGIYKDRNVQGMLSVVVDDFQFRGKNYQGLSLNIEKEGEWFTGDLLLHNAIADIEAKAEGDIEGEEKSLRLDMDFQRLDLTELIDMKAYKDYLIAGNLNLDVETQGLNSVEGELNLNNFSFVAPDNSRKLHLHQLKILADRSDSLQNINLKSDWVDVRAEGPYKLKDLPNQLKSLAASVFPALIDYEMPEGEPFVSEMDFDIVVKKNNSLPEFFNLPIRLLVPVTLSGSIDGPANSAWLTIDVPYLHQLKDKLIYGSRVTANIDGNAGIFNAQIETTVPVKKGDLSLNVSLWGHDNGVSTDLHWVNTENSDFKGHLMLDTSFKRNPLSRIPEVNLLIKPSVLQMGTADWYLSQCLIKYTDKRVEVNGLKLSHDDQYVEIEGVASPDYDDQVSVKLADIDVDYIFDMLQINYVTFGGVATGEITGYALLSGDPVAETESLVIKDFTYNGAALGECIATSRWNNEQKEIEIAADIRQYGRQTVDGSGGIWLGRDSLCFDISANKVPVDFVQPFMSVFSSHVGGYASGDVKLFGTFHDIDMTGKIFADSVAVKLDYTNTVYHGSDSVFLNPGQIEIPNFRLYDKYGNSALLTGELRHRYFHDPSFTFRLSDADNFLCYDTTQELNRDWYGTLYGSGSAYLTGVPGVTDISADMTVAGNSNFTFVLNDTEYAQDYQFLTFSDRRKEAQKSNVVTTQDLKEMLKKSIHQDEGSLSKFGIDIRATVTPQVLFTLVMDPAAGDKITARGRGAMQMKYESDNDELMMYGKYEIAEGNYNFSLQDIILRDFKIKEGSSIAFNGNPLSADLDISATYRVNTNLSDLDKSFSTDRDLNRTNVPVDAVLSVTGNMTSPDITFDIELPTLTQDVERKVKSIISTDDMMNRQIIYLLALNRFYTPEYMGSTTNGGELAAVASSTISSQLSNILGQLTDKFSVSPSFRSDKGDFSDIEVDVALSSRLLNNRLLINGNFGYRDRSNSSTTFVGDFDVEYLLSKNGNLRLKAYNHFNDQNYYLREALTTQGLGVVYRKDFDNWFTFLKKKPRKESEEATSLEEGNTMPDKDKQTNENGTED